MRRVVPRVLLLALVAAAAALLLPKLDGDAFADPPEGFATTRALGAELRHPGGWQRADERVVRVTARHGASRPPAVAELHSFVGTDPVHRAADRVTEHLRTGKRVESTAYEIDVPGADRSGATDVVFKGQDGRLHRITTVAAVDDRRLVVLAARGPVADGPADPRIVAGSLRLVD